MSKDLGRSLWRKSNEGGMASAAKGGEPFNRSQMFLEKLGVQFMERTSKKEGGSSYCK